MRNSHFAARIAASALALFVAPCLAQTTVAQHSWQKIQMPTAAEVASVWVAPPAEYGPEPYYGLNGPVTVESVARDLDTMKSLGFHTVTVQAGHGMKQAYLSPEYFAFFKEFVAEAEKRDMRVWIVDDAGYPSGFSGGRFSSDKPDLRMQALTLAQRIPVKPGETLSQPISANAVAAVALGTSGERMVVPIADGKIAWTAPASGEWTVLVVEHVFRTSPTRSDTNPTGLKDFSQSLEDYINPAATAAYIAFTHQQYFDTMPEEFGKTILGFRGDEPDYSIAGLPWTPAFFDRFQQEKGYDVRPYVAAILAAERNGRDRSGATPPPVQLTETERRAKADYYDIFSQMFRDGFFKPLALWAADHGVEYQVHLNHEEMEMELTHSEGDFLRDMKYIEEPGIDAIWHQIWTDTVSDFPRLASSAAHVYGHPRSFTESFAAYRPAPDVTMARYILNEQIVRGINTIETMFFSSTAKAPPPVAPTPEQAAAASMPALPPMRHGGPSPLMRDPAWPALMDYARRLTYVMSMGRPAASVALYLPSSSMWLGDSASDTAFVSTERMLSERQIDFDIINQDALAEDLVAGQGTLATMSGNQYHTIILPSVAVLTQTELNRLRGFARCGNKVLFLGRTPSIISGKTILDARAATPADFTFATVETSAQLPPTPTPPDQPPASALTPLIVPAAIEAALGKTVDYRSVSLDTRDPELKVMTRQLKDADVYLFFNEGATSGSHTVRLNHAPFISDCAILGGSGPENLGNNYHPPVVESWDPATGRVVPVPATQDKGAFIVKLDLKPYETRLIVVRLASRD
ncbi:MAG: glycosyl hydrolase [Acidobacteriaceae bacterium]|nr:glycosyl hydrolase [Acidobacteriaceae bacterium]